jgi:hypothetical protein
MTPLKIVNREDREAWRSAFSELENEIREVHNVAELGVLALHDRELTAFCIYQMQEKAQALRLKFAQLWEQAPKQVRSA